MRIILGWLSLRSRRLGKSLKKKTKPSSLTCLKEFRSGAWSRKSTITRDIYKEYRLGVVWKPSRALRSNICIVNICLPNICFHLLVNFLSLFWDPKFLLSSPFLWWHVTLKLPNLSIHPIFLWLSPINLSYVRLILTNQKNLEWIFFSFSNSDIHRFWKLGFKHLWK